MLKWVLSSCNRCGGDMFIDRDADGWYEQCLQCSHRRELNQLKNQLIPIRVNPTPHEDWSKQRGD
jgi:DNA-directed RNA polymerase subunit RPC12/RpoP